MTASAVSPSGGPARCTFQSKKQKPLQRYFPEIESGLLELEEDGFVLDGEFVVPGAGFETRSLHDGRPFTSAYTTAQLLQDIAHDRVAAMSRKLVNRDAAGLASFQQALLQ